MDILAHGLWAAGVYRAANLKVKSKERFNLWMAAFWGIFPDLFAFTIPFAWMIWNRIVNKVDFSQMRPENIEPIVNHLPVFQLANSLYNLSHSLIIFALVFGLVWFFRKKPYWEMGAWVLHIIMDIPTHTYRFFPTPFLWPISGVKANGISWADPLVLVLDFFLLVLVYVSLAVLRSRDRKKQNPR